MKLLQLLPLAVLATAIVLPDEQVLAEIAIEDHHDHKPSAPDSFVDELKQVVDDLKEQFEDVAEKSKNYLDEAIAVATDAGNKVSEKIHAAAFDVDSWLEGALDDPASLHGHGFFDRPPPPHGPPPDHPPPKDDPPRHPPHHGPPPHKRPHHPPHHHKSNLTIYQLISASKYTTKLAKLIDEDEDLVKVLNGTAANYTIFAPTDHAFEKIPDHGHKPSKELIKKVLLYHISPAFYPAGRVLHTHTIPTLLNSSALGEKPQRLSIRLGLKGLAVNFYSRVVATNIFATNGVIHGVDSIILPPPSVLAIIGLLPGEFSTLSLGLSKTGLLKELNETAHVGSTFFAPSNFAFKKLGPKINAFLFSKYGEKYLKALLQYHVVHNQTLYSDAFYNTEDSSSASELEMVAPMPKPRDGPHPPPKGPKGPKGPHGPPRKDKGPHNRRGGHYHLDLPTLLEDKSIAVDIARFGPFIEIKLNSFARVAVQDGVARDGVIQVVSNVLIPPKKPGKDEKSFWHGEEMSVEEFKDRLSPFVEGEQEEGLEL